MATCIWQSQDGDWSNTESWSTGTVPAGVGVDAAIFTGASQHPVVSGLDNDGVALTMLRIQPEYRGDIGNEQNPLKLISTKVVHKGGGTLWYEDGAGTTALMIIDTPAGHPGVVFMGGVITRVQIVRGMMICGSAAGLITWLGMSTDAAVLHTRRGSGGIAGLHMAAGRASIASDVVMFMRGGHATIPNDAPSIATWMQLGGTTIDFSQGATLTLLMLLGGIFDTTKRVQGTRTITNARVWPGADFRYVEDRITITNLHDMTGDGLTQAV